MKSCPSCHQNYDDESMLFCLADGAKLQPVTTAYVPQPTLVLPPTHVTDPGPTVASPQPTVPPTVASPPPPAQPTMLAPPPEPVRVNPPSYPPGYGPPERNRTSALPWLLAIALILGLSGIVIALILTRGGVGANQAAVASPTPTASPARSSEVTFDAPPSPIPQLRESPTASPATPAKSPERPPKGTDKSLPGTVVVTRPLPSETPTPERPKSMFSVLNNMTFNGSRITYYARPSFGMCQADCAGNPNCKGFTWIRPGAYNPGDAAMCYLMSAVTARVPHDCCISAVRN